MKQLFFIISALTLLGCDLKSSDEYLRIANKSTQQKRYSEAISILDKGHKSYPEDIRILIDRSFNKSMINDFIGSIKDDSIILQKDPQNTLVLLNRGKSKERIQDFYGAIKDFNKAISTKGGELVYLDKVPNSLIETGYEFDVKMEAIRFERGICYYYIDSLRKSFDDLNFSIQKNFALSDSYYWRGLIYLRYDMTKEGCEDLVRAKELGDTDAQELIDKHCKK